MPLKYLRNTLCAAALLSLNACGGQSGVTDSPKSDNIIASQDNSKPTLGSFGIDLNSRDESVKPGDNFFKYVNGTWIKTVEIPSDRSRYGGFGILRDISEERVKAIIENVATKPAAKGTDEQKIGDFYSAFMDVDAIEAAGMSAVQADLERIASVQTREEVATLLGDPALGLNSPMAPFIGIDSKDIENYIVFLTQSGLGMPNRDYYLDDNETADAQRAAYLTFLTKMLETSAADDVKARAKSIMAFETEIAQVHWTITKRRNRDLTYNKRTLAQIKSNASGFPWDAFLKASQLSDQTTFVVRETDAIEGMAKIFAKADIDVLKDYMTVSYLSAKSAYLPKFVGDARFEFYGKTLRGTPVERDRWKRAVSQIDRNMGEIVGKVYVKNHFPESSKAQMLDLIENLRGAFKTGIEDIEWMSETTKEQAQYKLAKFNPKIGYPDVWTDYSELDVDRADLIGTVKSAALWSWKDELNKLGGPIDRDEWGMNPQTVNAYYNPSLNEIVFPAAILQAPFFDPAADAAVNYGGIGAVIGHEMGHGFDDQGRKTDGDGQLRDWWTQEDGEAFKARADKLVAQFDSFEPLEGVNVNGRLTLGENIGDLTGLTMAYKAYKNSLGGQTPPVIDGLTGDQRFFMSYSQIWQVKMREEALRNQIKTDPHSPGEYRANGIVRNFDPWYEAFDVKPGDALYLPPEKRVKIW